MYRKDIPGLSHAEIASISAYEKALHAHAAQAMSGILGEPEDDSRDTADAEIEDSYRRLIELAPEDVPGGPGGMSYGMLLEVLQRRGIGERFGRLASEPLPSLEGLPDPVCLLHAEIDLEHYLRRAAYGREPLGRLYDTPDEEREQMSDEEIAAEHGDRHELARRLDHILDALADASSENPEEERTRKMFGLGFDCGADAGIFYACYEEDSSYVDGFVRGRLELLSEDEAEEEVEPVDFVLTLWEDEIASDEHKREMVLEPLKEGCQVREDEGDLWRT